MTFYWKGKAILTMGEIMDAALAAIEAGEASAFKNAYIDNLKAEGKNDAEDIVNSTLGYMSGYYDRETSAKILEAYGTVHPIFGASQPTPEEAYEMGKAKAQEAAR